LVETTFGVWVPENFKGKKRGPYFPGLGLEKQPFFFAQGNGSFSGKFPRADTPKGPNFKAQTCWGPLRPIGPTGWDTGFPFAIFSQLFPFGPFLTFQIPQFKVSGHLMLSLGTF